jgi:hypothetical protein
MIIHAGGDSNRKRMTNSEIRQCNIEPASPRQYRPERLVANVASIPRIAQLILDQPRIFPAHIAVISNAVRVTDTGVCV